MSKKKLETAQQVYVNDAFGKIRGMLIDGKPYFVGKDVATALGFKGKGANNAVKAHVDDEDKFFCRYENLLRRATGITYRNFS